MRHRNTILIIDDESVARDIMEGFLFKEGYDLIFAASGPDGLAQLDKLPPDLILLDVMMPGMSGFEICQRIKTDNRWRHIPIILVTALEDKQDLARGFEVGADDFLQKPVNELELRARVRSMLRIKSQYDELQHTSTHDALTNLPNRTLFMERLGGLIIGAERDRGHLFAVLFLDLDRFKLINDSLGHTMGDQLLIEVARRLEVCVRPGDVVARLGGDEFTILLHKIGHVNDAIQIAEELQAELIKPFKLGAHNVITSASIGIAMSNDRYKHPEDFLRDADLAMYEAKRGGRARYEIFEANMHVEAMTNLQLKTDLQQAFERQKFEVYYQPIVSLKTEKIIGAEALVRWQHPQLGILFPDQFIPLVEDTGLIESFGAWVLQTACSQTRTWYEMGYDPLRIMINVSIHQFRQQNLSQLIKTTLDETGLAAKCLELELTEKFSGANTEIDLPKLDQLKDIGLHLAVGDFNLCSCLKILHDYPINTLKIDRTLIEGIINEDTTVSTIVAAIINFAHHLNLKVIAEGVETKEQLSFLRSHQCDEVQGFLYSPPIPAEMFTGLLEKY